MATQKDDSLHLINAATQSELKLVERAQFYRMGDEVVIGDLYKDPDDPAVAVVQVLRRTTLKDITQTIEQPSHDRRKEDRNNEETEEERTAREARAKLEDLKKGI